MQQGGLRISNLSSAGQIINFLRVNSLTIFLVISLLILIIGKSSNALNNRIKNIASEIIIPSYVIIKLPVTSSIIVKEEIKNIFKVKIQNESLKKDNALLREQLFKMLYLKEENIILKDLLNYQRKPEDNFITSRIYINVNDAFNKLVVIDKGENHNVKKGHAVITNNGLLGRVSKTSKNNSHIILITDYKSRIPIYSSESREKGVLVGRSNDNPRLKYLKNNHEVKENEIIYTSGDGLVYPADIPIGTTIITEKNEVEVIPFVNFNKADIVKIITSPFTNKVD
ncbi:MAG: rod shape-determining protein MreC [Rickettsiales bacterium]|nr:rod shape-determining protein MreC [Rickettsiales bacterium]